MLAALRSLPVEQQLLLEMFYWEDFDRDQLAEVFGVETATIGSRLTRARQTLQRNLATRDNWGFNVNTPIPIAKWWNGNLNAFYNYSINKADYGEGRIIDLRVSGGGFWTQQTFTLSKTLTAEASGWYNWGGLWGAYVQRPQGMMDVGLSKRLWDGAGTLRVSFTDVFHTAGWSSYTKVGDLYITAKGAWEGQQFKINMTYRFGNNNLQNVRRRTSGADDESKRASGGE